MSLPLEALEERKNGLVSALSEQYAQNLFSLEEYERLVEYAQKIETPREAVLLDRILRENAVGNPADDTGYRGAASGEKGGFFPHHLAILSSRHIDGLPPLGQGGRDFVSILADCQVFINEADLIQEETVVNANALLGEVVFHVPETATVINRAVPILGAVTVAKRKKSAPLFLSEKKIVITGAAVLGNITIKYRK